MIIELTPEELRIALAPWVTQTLGEPAEIETLQIKVSGGFQEAPKVFLTLSMAQVADHTNTNTNKQTLNSN